MSKLVWDAVGSRIYETGDDHAVLYLQNSDGTYANGVAWNGITAVSESPSGAEANPIYADNIKYVDLRSAEEFGATIEAYTYPDEWAECDGSKEIAEGVYAGQQTRRPFGFSYRSLIGNDTEMDAHGYKLHLIYNATASPSEKGYATVNDSPDAITFSWEISTTPIAITGFPSFKPTAALTIDSTKADHDSLTTLENALYGTENSEPTLPLPHLVVAMFSSGSTGETGATGSTGSTGSTGG